MRQGPGGSLASLVRAEPTAVGSLALWGDWGPAPARVPVPGTLCHPAEPQGGPWGWESRNLVVSQVRSPWSFPLARSTWGRPEVLSGPEGTSGFF